MGGLALEGGGGWWVVVVVDVLWSLLRERCWRDAHVKVLGARKSRTGCCVLRGIVRAHAREHNAMDDIFSLYCTIAIAQGE